MRFCILPWSGDKNSSIIHRSFHPLQVPICTSSAAVPCGRRVRLRSPGPCKRKRKDRPLHCLFWYFFKRFLSLSLARRWEGGDKPTLRQIDSTFGLNCPHYGTPFGCYKPILLPRIVSRSSPPQSSSVILKKPNKNYELQSNYYAMISSLRLYVYEHWSMHNDVTSLLTFLLICFWFMNMWIVIHCVTCGQWLKQLQEKWEYVRTLISVSASE